MLPFLIYLIAGALTAYQVFALVLLYVNSPLELVSLVGSLVLLVAAYVSLWKPRVAAQIALVGALLVWCFYAPATVNTVRARSAGHGVVPAVDKGR